MTRVYRRLGTRYATVAVIAALQVQYAVFAMGVLILQVYIPMSAAELASILGAVFALQTADHVVAAAAMRRRLRPVTAWLAGRRDPATTQHAWEAAGSLSSAFVRHELRAAYPIAASILSCVFITWRLDLPLTGSLAVFAGAAVTIVYALAIVFLLLEQLLRPVLEDIADALPAELASPMAGVPIRKRLLIAVPATNVVTGVVVAALSARGDLDVTDLGAQVVLSLGVALTFAFAVSYPLSKSVADPIARIREATERVRRGDYDVRVAIASSDETAALARSFNGMVAAVRERERLRDAFGAFVDPELTDRVLEEGLDFSGEEVDASIVFIDVRGFTAFAESATPASVVARLNTLFADIVPIVREHGGHANKFIGDGLMAVFGTPERLASHADQAVAAALAIAAHVRETWGDAMRVGIGVNSGPVVAGTVGGGGRLEFTVIGDSVNTAARVEAATRDTGDDVLVTTETLRRMERRGTRWEPRPAVALKGKHAPVDLWAPRVAVPSV